MRQHINNNDLSKLLNLRGLDEFVFWFLNYLIIMIYIVIIF